MAGRERSRSQGPGVLVSLLSALGSASSATNEGDQTHSSPRLLLALQLGGSLTAASVGSIPCRGGSYSLGSDSCPGLPTV